MSMHANILSLRLLIRLMILCVAAFLTTVPVFATEPSNHTSQEPESDGQNLEASTYIPIRSLLTDKELMNDRTIYLRGGRNGGKGIVNQFVGNITMDLIDDITDFNSLESTKYYNVSESLVTEITEYSMMNGEIREVNYIKKRKATSAVLNAVMDVAEKTPLYHNLKTLETTISKYFFIEYSKSTTNSKGSLYIPGQSLPKKTNGEELYKITLSTLFYSSSNTYKGNYSLELAFKYLSTEACSLYDFGRQEAKFRLRNERLNHYLSSNWDFTVIHNNEDTTTFVLKMLFNY